MSIKADAPEEDPETRARREAAERRADAGRIEETRENLTDETRSILRQFGRSQPGAILSSFASQQGTGGQPLSGTNPNFGGFGNGFSGGGLGSRLNLF